MAWSSHVDNAKAACVSSRYDAVILAESMDSTNLFHAVLLRAAELLGGTEPLARRLHVSAEELTRWLAGEGIVDIGILPCAIDVLLDPSPPPN
jgi:hypothetical protein